MKKEKQLTKKQMKKDIKEYLGWIEKNINEIIKQEKVSDLEKTTPMHLVDFINTNMLQQFIASEESDNTCDDCSSKDESCNVGSRYDN